MTLTLLLILLIVMAGGFTQSLTGFGLALVIMPPLSVLLGVEVAAPIVAAIALVVQTILLRHFRQALNFTAVWRLALGAAIAVPIGVYGLKRIEGETLLTVLGVILVGYSLYALLRFRLPALTWRGWAYLFGFAGGLLGGAYNTAGPPYIIYGNCRRWPPAEFKSNLQAVFLVNGSIALLAHTISGNFNPLVWRYILFSVPAVLLGIWLGLRLDKRINPSLFRQIVLVLLLVIGVRLLF